MSEADCTSKDIAAGACIWGTSCTQPNCSAITTQVACNALNNCSWSSNNKCITTNCALLTSTSSGGCATQLCSQSNTINADGSYNCIAFAISPPFYQACSAQTTNTSCQQLTYCTWNTSCKDASCASLSAANCNFVFKDSANATSVAQLCFNGTTCSDAYQANFSVLNCYTKTMFYYTWSTAKSYCVNCATGLTSKLNMLPHFFLAFIMIFM